MKSLGRALRLVLAASVLAAPAAAQVRVGEIPAQAEGARVGVAPVALGASAVPAALTSLPAASLPSGAGSAPSAAPSAAPALVPAASVAAPAAAAAAPAGAPVEQYRALQRQYAAIETTVSPFLSYTPGSLSDAEYQNRLDRMQALSAQMRALEAVRPTIAYEAQGAIARAWDRLTGRAPSAQALADAAFLPAAASGRSFDGAAGKSAAPSLAEDVEAPEDLPTDVSDAAAQMPELFVTRESRNGIKAGKLTVHVGLIKSKGSEWYWGKFKKGALIAVKSGTMTLFVSRVEAAKTVKIASLQKQDFEGMFTPQRMAGKTVADLRNMLIQDLKDRQSRRPGAPTPVSSQSEVRVVRFLSAKKAMELPENKEESAYPVAPRADVVLPEALQGLNHTLPKVVFLDMRLFKDGVPYPLIEDMSKLMKTGVYFVMLSDKPNGAAGSIDDLLSKQLTVKQRDQISRYKMLMLADDGNSLNGHSGNFASPLPSRRFTPQELEIMSFVATTRAPFASIDAKSTKFEVVLTKGADAQAAKAALVEGIRAMRLDAHEWQWTVTERDGRSVVTARPQSLVSAMPHLFEVMREREGLFVNNSDVMVISRDEKLLAALPGAIAPAQHLRSDGTQFVDESLASLVGPYRINKPGDLAASASKIQSFLQGRTGGGFDGGNVYMMTGHVMHSAFNWAVWKYRNTGVLPTAEETVETARKIWEEEVSKGTGKNLLGRPGESLAGFYETVEQRLRAMHAVAADVLKVYPIAVGTELPNLFVADRYKKGGVEDHRDIFRLIFDFVVAREVAPGKIEIVIVDFKTGQVPTLQNLEKDTQVQLYDMLVRRMWPTLRVPYGATGKTAEVTDYKLNFLYTAGAYQPSLNDWSRLKFDKFLKNVMNRIRNFNNPKPKKDAAKGKAAAKKDGAKAAPAAPAVKVDRSRPKTADADSLTLPQVVPGLKIKKQFAQQIIAGTKKIEYRTVSTNPKPFVAIIQTFTDEEPGRPAEVVGFARIEKVTQADGQYEWHLTHVTPVKPYVVPNNKPGAIIWVKDVPVQGPKNLKK